MSTFTSMQFYHCCHWWQDHGGIVTDALPPGDNNNDDIAIVDSSEFGKKRPKIQKRIYLRYFNPE